MKIEEYFRKKPVKVEHHATRDGSRGGLLAVSREALGVMVDAMTLSSRLLCPYHRVFRVKILPVSVIQLPLVDFQSTELLQYHSHYLDIFVLSSGLRDAELLYSQSLVEFPLLMHMWQRLFLNHVVASLFPLFGQPS